MILQGRLTKDPELKRTQSDIARLEFTAAWSEKYKEVEKKCFLRCIAWRQTAEFINKYFKKGQEIAIEGYMVTEEWDKDGEHKSRTVCVVEKAHFCGPKKDGGGSSNTGGSTMPEEANVGEWVNVPAGIDDELPFA